MSSQDWELNDKSYLQHYVNNYTLWDAELFMKQPRNILGLTPIPHMSIKHYMN